MLLYIELSIPVTLEKEVLSFTILYNCLSGKIMLHLGIIQSKEKQILPNTYTPVRVKLMEGIHFRSPRVLLKSGSPNVTECRFSGIVLKHRFTLRKSRL